MFTYTHGKIYYALYACYIYVALNTHYYGPISAAS
jgi:hypothetical protein